MTRKFPSVSHEESWLNPLKYEESCLKASCLISYSTKYRSFLHKENWDNSVLHFLAAATFTVKRCTIVVSWQQIHINIQTTKRLFFCLWHNPKHMEILVCLAQLQIHNRFSLFQIHLGAIWTNRYIDFLDNNIVIMRKYHIHKHLSLYIYMGKVSIHVYIALV